MKRRGIAWIAAAVVMLAGAPAADAVIPAQWKNCAPVNARYPHGVGRVNARDHTRGEAVTSFTRSNQLYAEAIAARFGALALFLMHVASGNSTTIVCGDLAPRTSR